MIYYREKSSSFPSVWKRGTLLISCGILSPVYQTFALFVVYAAFPHLTFIVGFSDSIGIA